MLCRGHAAPSQAAPELLRVLKTLAGISASRSWQQRSLLYTHTAAQLLLAKVASFQLFCSRVHAYAQTRAQQLCTPLLLTAAANGPNAMPTHKPEKRRR